MQSRIVQSLEPRLNMTLKGGATGDIIKRERDREERPMSLW